MARGNVANIMYEQYHSNDTIHAMTFDEWENIRESIERREYRRNREEKRRLIRYFRKQKTFGLKIIIVAMIVAVLGQISGFIPLYYFGAGFGIVGLYFTLTKEMMVYDFDYADLMEKYNEYY